MFNQLLSALIQKDSHLLEVCRYVVLNPVRAKAVEKPELWRWSSYRATAGMGKQHPCLNMEWILNQFGSTRSIAGETYRKFVNDGITQESIWKAVRAQSILGEEEFSARFTDYLTGSRIISEEREILLNSRRVSDI